MPIQFQVTNAAISLSFIFPGKRQGHSMNCMWKKPEQNPVPSPIITQPLTARRGCDPRVISLSVWQLKLKSRLKSKLSRVSTAYYTLGSKCGIVCRWQLYSMLRCLFCYKLIKWKIIVCRQSESSETPQRCRCRCRQTEPSSKCFCNFNCSAPNAWRCQIWLVTAAQIHRYGQ